MNPNDMSKLVANVMRAQLDVTPKPGLVDKHGTGAHTDLDYDMMQRVIATLEPHWATFAEAGLFVGERSDKELSEIMQKIGETVIEEMYSVTGGVNAYKGTVFCVGLLITAYYRLIRLKKPVTSVAICEQIASLAQYVRRKKDTHGDWVNESYGISGALGEAQAGYKQWLIDAMPIYRKAREEESLPRFFLYLVAHLKDSCLYYRAGAELAQNAATIADYLYQSYSPEDVETMCRYFERCHLSTGGAGDILTLMMLADVLIP
jgi:triphosphoribosyl-dephospho-CoA synthase